MTNIPDTLSWGLIHRSAWKVDAPKLNFRYHDFSEVRRIRGSTQEVASCSKVERSKGVSHGVYPSC
jgi:hypothetical protein